MTSTADFDAYPAARERFRLAAARAGFRLEEYPTGLEGPDGTALTLDAAVLGDRSPARLVIVSGGLHGVEGPFGAMVIDRLLETGLAGWSPPPGQALALIHALNPYGYAHARRFDADNVDLNRNFLLDGQEYRGSPPLYAALDPFLNPKGAPGRVDPFLALAPLVVARYGMTDLKQAIAGGQHDFPLGLFFGGHRPSPLRAWLADRLDAWAGPAGEVLQLDFHTGLGTHADYTLLIDPCVRSEQVAWLTARFGADRVRPSLPGGIAYEVRGGLGTWSHESFPPRRHILVCAEFGTYGPLTVLGALRAENRAHHWGRPGAATTLAAKRRIREAFVPASPRWRSAATDRGVALIRTALAAWDDG